MEKEVKKDLVIGYCAGYDWGTLKYWCNSLQQSGFTGDKILITPDNLDGETTQKIINCGIQPIIMKFGTDKLNNIPPHVQRFAAIHFLLWGIQTAGEEKYNFIISTDVRDVVFQSDPSIWLKENIINKREILAPSENITYENEDWGKNNYLAAFGEVKFEQMKKNTIYNVGTIAGKFKYMIPFSEILFDMSCNKPIPIVDQAVFNHLIHSPICYEKTQFISHSGGWACQAGVTMDPTKLNEFRPHFLQGEPIWNPDDSCVYTEHNRKYVLFHQWDRCSPGIKTAIMKKYG